MLKLDQKIFKSTAYNMTRWGQVLEWCVTITIKSSTFDGFQKFFNFLNSGEKCEKSSRKVINKNGFQ